MKKIFALLLGVLLVLTLAFAACSQPASTTREIRWDENGETHVYKLSLSDFAEQDNKLFNNYSRTVMQKNSDGEMKANLITCYKDDIISSSDSMIFANAEEIRPLDVNGVFEMTIGKNTSMTWKLQTRQEMYCQYSTEQLKELGCLDKLAAYVVTGDNNPFTDNDGRTTLKSETKTSVVFSNDEKQVPSVSTLEIKGYYIGKADQDVSDCKYETTYDFDNRKVSVKKDGGEVEERNLGIAKGATCIDSAQILLYVRSLDKSSAAFADSPSVAVYDVTTDKVATANFAINRSVNLIVDNSGSEAIVPANAIAVTVGGSPLMAQYNWSDLTKTGDDGFDWLLPSGSNNKRCKYTTIKFRSGWCSYELAEYDQQIINAAKYEIAPSAE